MDKCPMVYHMDKRTKIEVPCVGCNCAKKAIACGGDTHCLICGMCKAHCVGHVLIRDHLIRANTVGA